MSGRAEYAECGIGADIDIARYITPACAQADAGSLDRDHADLVGAFDIVQHLADERAVLGYHDLEQQVIYAVDFFQVLVAAGDCRGGFGRHRRQYEAPRDDKIQDAGSDQR